MGTSLTFSVSGRSCAERMAVLGKARGVDGSPGGILGTPRRWELLRSGTAVIHCPFGGDLLPGCAPHGDLGAVFTPFPQFPRDKPIGWVLWGPRFSTRGLNLGRLLGKSAPWRLHLRRGGAFFLQIPTFSANSAPRHRRTHRRSPYIVKDGTRPLQTTKSPRFRPPHQKKNGRKAEIFTFFPFPPVWGLIWG